MEEVSANRREGASPAVGAGGVEIPSNLLISSGCLGLSGLNLTNCACGGGAEALRPRYLECPASGGGGLVGLGGLRLHGPVGLVRVAGGGLGAGIGGGLS